jgi:peptide deformylase
MKLELKRDPYPLLYQKVKPFDFEELDAKDIEKQMIDIMLANKGIGLAANQVGLDAQIFVMGSDFIKDFPKPFAVINPEITETSEEIKLDNEGCLSFPGLFFSVQRPEWIKAKFTMSDGNEVEVKVDGYLGKCFQHEFDHLQGICYTNRVSKLKVDMARKRLDKQYKKVMARNT